MGKIVNASKKYRKKGRFTASMTFTFLWIGDCVLEWCPLTLLFDVTARWWGTRVEPTSVSVSVSVHILANRGGAGELSHFLLRVP